MITPNGVLSHPDVLIKELAKMLAAIDSQCDARGRISRITAALRDAVHLLLTSVALATRSYAPQIARHMTIRSDILEYDKKVITSPGWKCQYPVQGRLVLKRFCNEDRTRCSVGTITLDIDMKAEPTFIVNFETYGHGIASLVALMEAAGSEWDRFQTAFNYRAGGSTVPPSVEDDYDVGALLYGRELVRYFAEHPSDIFSMESFGLGFTANDDLRLHTVLSAACALAVAHQIFHQGGNHGDAVNIIARAAALGYPQS